MITVNKNGIIDLWEATFGDSREYVDSFIKAFSDNAKFLTKEIDGKIVSMLCMIECDLVSDFETYKSKYIYACATSKEYKKSGFMTELLEQAKKEAENDGVDFLVLVPANEELFEFYEKRGYHKFFKTKKIEISARILKLLSKGDAANEQTEADTLNSMRKKLLTKKPYIAWTNEHIAFAAESYTGRVLFSENIGYAFVRQDGSVAYIDEICAAPEKFCELLKIICDNFDAENYCFSVPMDCPFTSDRFDVTDKGMILPLKNKINSDGYIGLVME